MTEVHEDDFWGDLSWRMVATFAMWLEEQENGQELVAALHLVNDVVARQERGQVILPEQIQAAFDATLQLHAVTVSHWKDIHAVFEMLSERFLSLLPDASERSSTEDDWDDDEDVIDTLGKWWCEDCETWHVGCFCPKDDGE